MHVHVPLEHLMFREVRRPEGIRYLETGISGGPPYGC